MFKKAREIYCKVRKHGIVKSFQIVVYPLYKFCKYQLPWPLKPASYFSLMRLIFTPNFQKKRILGIWDFKALPWSVGDPMLFIEKLSILKIEHNAEEIDICIVYDRDNPIGNRAGRNVNITSDNAQEYMLEFLPLFSTCPYLGSIYQFNSRKEFYHFLKSSVERYDIFPLLGQHLGETYNFRDGACSHYIEIQSFYNIRGFIPYLRIGNRDSSWAKWFYLNYLPDRTVPVALSMKKTSHAEERNADSAAWLSFIDRCKVDFSEVTFVIVGLREEVFDGLRERPNVIIAKDYGTSIIEDLALIYTSLMYIGTTSGINAIALFSDLPYLIFQWPQIHKLGLKLGESFSFATDMQKIFSSTILVTPELLLDEFKKLYSKLDRGKWFSRTFKEACNKQGHPAGRVGDKK